MGNNSSRESRGHDPPNHLGRTTSSGSGPTSPNPAVYTARGGRGSRPDLSFLGIGSSNANSDHPERRETKQEREARKLEKERIAREKERERSIREEHVDGGYLVTMGVYTGPEDFSKPTVRQLMIERRIAPFWRGLDDFKEEWTEHQLVAAGRGLPIPAADEIPQDASSVESPHASNPNLQNLTVPIASRSHSAASDASATLSPSHPAFSLPSPTSPISPQATHTSHSPFRPRSKTLASLTTSSKNPPQADMVPREIQLPTDRYVNGQAIEVFLYKDATECPICFLYYPPYLNKTRCCDQPICSECFVQIKRPDPHPPEHEHNDPSNPTPAGPPTEDPESLVSEPSTCPYCQQAEFGVTYDPPPFRRGLAYANPGPISNFSSAMSSSSSVNSATSPTLGPALAPVERNKRRTTSISANASTVITTDRIRPDWAIKLANARAHLARRSAAATALHSAAYLMGNNATDSRSFGFGGRHSRFGRHRGDSSPNAAGDSGAREPNLRPDGGSHSSRRRSRIDDLEEMMMMEAIRLSLAAEEERKRKSDKEAQKQAEKEAKKKAKEEKKKEKKERKVYGSGANSASGSALSLSLPGIGRRRGNSGASNLAKEVTPETAEPDSPDPKGKGVERGPPAHSIPIDVVAPRAGSSSGFPGARHLDTNHTFVPDHQPSPTTGTAPEKPSHLRQMSNASSPSSSFSESVPNSIRNDAHGSSSSLDVSNTGNEARTAEENGTEPMFNFRSLASMLGHEDPDDKDVARHIEHLEDGSGGSSSNPFAEAFPVNNVGRSRASSHVADLEGLDLSSSPATSGMEKSVSTITENTKHGPLLGAENGNVTPTKSEEQNRQTTALESQRTTPEVMITPVTPAALGAENEHSKQLGAGWSHGAREITQ